MSVQDDTLQPVDSGKRYIQLEKQYTGHPLLAELDSLHRQYQRLERRLNKIARIGDLMQAQIMDLNSELDKRAKTDPLTGLFNRGGLYPQMFALKKQLELNHSCFGVLLLDLDYFKEVNDQCGHLQGDHLLISVAAILQSICSTQGVCARWGGEEFLILMPDCSEKSLHAMAENIMQAIRSVPLPGNDERYLSASIGVYFCREAEMIDDSIRKADLAMYKAKAQGRDQLVTYSPELGETKVVL